MSQVCFNKATRTSRRTVTTTSRSTEYRYGPITLPPSNSPVQSTSTCVVTIGCSAKLVTRYTPVPGRVITGQVPIATLTVYDLAPSVTTFYTTSCTVYTGAYPTTITDPTVAIPISQSGDSQGELVPVWTIVGAVIGSVGGAVLIGILIYLLCFRKKRAKGNNQYPVSPYAQPQLGGQLFQPYTNGEPYMRSLDETPYTSSGHVFRQNSFQSGQNHYSLQGPGTGPLSQEPPIGQSALAIIRRNTTTKASNSTQPEPRTRAAFLPPGITPSHPQGAVSRPISSDSSPLPPLGSEFYSVSIFDHNSASNPAPSLLFQQHRQSENHP